MTEPLPPPFRRALLHDEISQPNKMHLIAGWRSRGFFVAYRFQGEALRTRMLVQLEPDGPWVPCRSFEFDVRPLLKFSRE